MCVSQTWLPSEKTCSNSPAEALLRSPRLCFAPCRGVDAVQDAVELLQSGRSIGKVYAQIATDLPSHANSRL